MSGLLFAIPDVKAPNMLNFAQAISRRLEVQPTNPEPHNNPRDEPDNATTIINLERDPYNKHDQDCSEAHDDHK